MKINQWFLILWIGLQLQYHVSFSSVRKALGKTLQLISEGEGFEGLHLVLTVSNITPHMLKAHSTFWCSDWPVPSPVFLCFWIGITLQGWEFCCNAEKTIMQTHSCTACKTFGNIYLFFSTGWYIYFDHTSIHKFMISYTDFSFLHCWYETSIKNKKYNWSYTINKSLCTRNVNLDNVQSEHTSTTLKMLLQFQTIFYCQVTIRTFSTFF